MHGYIAIHSALNMRILGLRANFDLTFIVSEEMQLIGSSVAKPKYGTEQLALLFIPQLGFLLTKSTDAGRR
jgi:hypothetical protein